MGRNRHITLKNQRKRKNMHKASGKSTTEQEQQPKTQHATLPVSDGSRRPSSSSPNSSGGAEEPESDSDTASDSDAGDIPFDNGIPEKLVRYRSIFCCQYLLMMLDYSHLVDNGVVQGVNQAPRPWHSKRFKARMIHRQTATRPKPKLTTKFIQRRKKRRWSWYRHKVHPRTILGLLFLHQ